MKILTRKRFGLPADPWAGLQMETTDAARVGQMVEAAAEVKAMVSVLGPRGSGKTSTTRAALRRLNVQVVEPLRLDRERLHLGDIQSAIVRDLSDETPRRSGEARSHQVRRVLGGASRERPVVLVLDDAHVLHPSTLRGLKRLRELAWLGVSPLLGVVLLGQHDRAEQVPEVALRSDRLWLAGLTPVEAAQALDTALNADRRVLASNAVAALAASPRARNWLDLQALADDCLAEAAARGEEAITAAAVAVVLGVKQRPAPAAQAPAAPEDTAVTELLTRNRARKSA